MQENVGDKILYGMALPCNPGRRNKRKSILAPLSLSTRCLKKGILHTGIVDATNFEIGYRVTRVSLQRIGQRLRHNNSAMCI